MKLFTLFAIALLSYLPAFSQPSNDNCSGAITITATTGDNCGTAVSGTTIGATADAGIPGTCTGTENDDVWYKFVATATSHTIAFTNVSGGTTDLTHQVFSGTCGSLTLLNCEDPNTSYIHGLTIGQTYYVRVYTWSSSATTTSSFDICIYGVQPPPSNDECSGAISLTPSSSSLCSSPVSGTTENATPSSTAAPSCSADGINDDVWYSFVAAATTHTVKISDATSTTAVALYSGSCGTLTQITGACASTNLSVAGLTPGTTYFVRVYSTSTYSANFSNFNICIAVPPANDNCADAITLNVSSSNACTSPTQGTTVGATASTETAPSCNATGTNDDVWYKFVATATSHTVTLYNETSTSAVALYSGSCGSLTQISGACATTTAGGIVVNSLTVGNTYYLRVYTTSSTATIFGDFTICVGVLPTHNECSGAISLSSNSATCSATAGSTIGATQSADAAPSCSASGRNDDVWYSFVANNTTQIISVSNANTTTAAAIYSGACGSLTQITGACASGGTTVTGLTVGQTYYVRVYSTSSTSTTSSTFDICVMVPPPPPANDECTNAVTISGVTNGTTVGATQSMAQETCGTATASAANDAWFKFTATANGSAVIDVTNVSSTFDAVLMVYSGTCGALSNIGCADGPGAGGSETTTLNGLTAGTTYYARVYGFNANDGTFSIGVSGAAMPVTISEFKGERINKKNILKWTTASEFNSAVYELQRSIDGINFSLVASTATKAPGGTSNTSLSYEITDHKSPASTSYYRLKQIDKDGSSHYSSVVMLKGEKITGLQLGAVFPNPVKDNLNVTILSGTTSSVSLVITDVAGKQVMSRLFTVSGGEVMIPLNIAALSPGTYVLQALSGNLQSKGLVIIKR